MTQSTISPLRQRMIDDMTLRRLSDQTQAAYIRAVVRLVDYLKRSPDTATAEDLRAFQRYLVEQDTSPQTINATIRGLSFFFDITLDRPEVLKRLSRVRVPEKLPFVLSQQAVVRLLNGAPNIKARTALSVAYGTGLRAAEITRIKLTDIDSQRMIIRVDQGKGSRDRQAMLSPTLLALLRDWWRAANKAGKMLPNGWLFPGLNPVNPITPRQLNRYCKAAAKAANLDKRISLHTLRHCFATHLLDDKVDIRVIQVLLGHKKLDTTARYTRVAARILHEVKSPLDQVQRPIT